MTKVLIAIGGNALVLEGEPGDLEVQRRRCAEIAEQIAELVAAGHQVVLTHGNGPQVGYILRRGELLRDVAAAEGLPELPLWLAVADSQGGIGHLLAVAIDNAMAARGRTTRAITVLTHAVVADDDPAFENPTKPIGSLIPAAHEAARRAEGWSLIPAGTGFRRVVPSPLPQTILESGQIKALIGTDAVVVAAGGGGVPLVSRVGHPGWEPVDAVIDKDRSSAILAAEMQVDMLVLVTGVENVYTGFGTPDQRRLDHVTASEIRELHAAGEFPPGSMGPKVEAALSYLEGGTGTAVITALPNVRAAIEGHAGTRISNNEVEKQ